MWLVETAACLAVPREPVGIPESFVSSPKPMPERSAALDLVGICSLLWRILRS